MWETRQNSVCILPSAGSVTSLFLQQGRDVDVPANGLAIKAAGEQVARLVLFVPGCATNHPPVTLQDINNISVLIPARWSFLGQSVGSHHSVAAWQPGQPHSAHVEQSDLPIVMWKSDDPLVGRDADPERADTWESFLTKTFLGELM